MPSLTVKKRLIKYFPIEMSFHGKKRMTLCGKRRTSGGRNLSWNIEGAGICSKLSVPWTKLNN
jgi:hypothetical protein